MGDRTLVLEVTLIDLFCLLFDAAHAAQVLLWRLTQAIPKTWAFRSLPLGQHWL